MAAGAVSVPLIIPMARRETRGAKSHIDTDTRVSIQSDTPGVLIFYTLDGSRPAALQRGSAASSRKYRGPILLPAGRVVVRAVAVTSDGRESSTVTKAFLVEFVDSNRKENENFLRIDEQNPSEGSLWPSGTSAGSSEPRMMGNAFPQSGPRSLGLSSPTRAAQGSQSADPDTQTRPNSEQTSWMKRETDFLRDGRDSFTVNTGSLDDLLHSNRKENFLQRKEQKLSEGTFQSAENSTGSSEPRMMGNAFPQSGPRSLGLSSPTRAAQGSQSADPDTQTRPNSEQTSWMKRETDFLRCDQCLSLRPSDPLAWFCPHCGDVFPRLLEQKFLPVEEGQLVSCVFCNTHVPINTHTCFTCEASVHPQQDHVICVVCGSGNPAHISSCLTCESCLQQAVRVGSSVPSVPSADSRIVSCTRCNRINRHDARFCNWCGSKTGPAANYVLCWQCGASGHPFASYCSACGVFLDTPAPPTSHDITSPTGGTVNNQASRPLDHAPIQELATPTADQCTQTVGLYFPSANQLQKKEQQKALQVNRQQATRDRQPLLTTVSPGRGYWRRQLDHVCAHLRSYAQNHAGFRALLGEPRLGQMVSAAVWEDGDEVNLTVSFVSAGRERKQVDAAGGGVGPTAGRTNNLSSVTERRADSNR